MQELEIKNFIPQIEARLLKLNYDVLPISVGTTVNLTVQDEVVITKVEKNSITFECSRHLIMEPKSIFEANATCFVKRTVDPSLSETIDLTTCENLNEFIQHNLANLVNTAYANMSHLFSSVTSSFGGAPFITPPIPTPNTKIIRKV